MKLELHLFFLEIVELNGNQLKNHQTWIGQNFNFAGCLFLKQISTDRLATAHYCLASVRNKSKAVPDIGQELSSNKNEAQDPFSRIFDIVVESDN